MISGIPLFPGGASGVGLLLLRLAVAGSLLTQAATHAQTPNAAQFIAILLAAALCAGFRTSVAACISGVALLAALPSLDAALHAATAAALALTGPGALSADARLFGRRTVTLPERDDTIV